MNLNEFLNFRPQCFICNEPNNLNISASIHERIDGESVYVYGKFFASPTEENSATFTKAKLTAVASTPEIDTKAFDTNKFINLSLNNDIVSFTTEFKYSMTFVLNMECPEHHYSYSSRRIDISDTSAYIAQGYPVVSETLMYQDFVVISRQKKNRTTIYPPYNDDFLTEENQTVIPYQDITSFQHEDKDMFINRLQKIMMLA